MRVTESIEEKKEYREVTVTLGFEFEDGKCIDEKDQAIYDLVAPVGDEIVSDEDMPNENESVVAYSRN